MKPWDFSSVLIWKLNARLRQAVSTHCCLFLLILASATEETCFQDSYGSKKALSAKHELRQGIQTIVNSATSSAKLQTKLKSYTLNTVFRAVDTKNMPKSGISQSEQHSIKRRAAATHSGRALGYQFFCFELLLFITSSTFVWL
jgi:hypothetical protein